jgi:hypothetical protein
MVSSCGQSQSEIDAAKQKLLNQNPVEQSETIDQVSQENESDSNKEVQKYVQIIPLTEKQFLDFDSILESSLSSGEVKISGTTNTQVEKIEVLFSNPTSNYPDDDYVLQTFKP